ncbi:hypothetical protein CGCS363_v015052 [Colletotrichum siamense]|uniref:uncharacterized protein n=1 Tax=Colletotrichum siamense TaxID=690259 RepID=UPI0018726989|nr:uncharacterized protein CGCS363_v015052 [Colletotrichum siamense]KAF5483044.1 hypothetical protein CGCS363_v015052 [Colletotrichum siamense]
MIEYFGKAVADLGVRINENVLGVMDLIDICVFEDELLDSGLIAQYFTLDVICDVALGRLFCNLASHLDVPEYFHMTERKMLSIIVAAALPSLLTVLLSGFWRLLFSEAMTPAFKC